MTARADYASVDITGLTADSRRVQPGFLFAALAGATSDGRGFIGDAIDRGAVAVLAPPGVTLPAPTATGGREVALIIDDNPRRRFAHLAACYYRRQPRTVAAVTGTNGKTSVAWFLRQIWSKLGHAAGSLGTLGVQAPGVVVAGGLTTPDPVALHATLAQLAASGVDHLAMEASSHGLDQYRLDGVRVAVGGFTNLTRDHLDYHKTFAAYANAKRRLFTDIVDEGGAAVINADDEAAATMIEAAQGRGLRVLTYGARGRDLVLDGLSVGDDGGQVLRARVLGAPFTVGLPLAGDFQAANALCAAGMAIATGSPVAATLAALGSLVAVRGRLERVGRTAEGGAVFVDYAHTPDALAVVLRALRRQCPGRLHVVFGCGGDRDAGKRPLMGRIAGELADRVLVTDDNPRGEDPAAIRRQILGGCPGATEIGDRALAIATALDGLGAGDVLLIAGKGHETGQIIGDTVHPFDDAAVAQALLAETPA